MTAPCGSHVGRLFDEVEGDRADQHARAEAHDQPDRAQADPEAKRDECADHERRSGQQPPAEGCRHLSVPAPRDRREWRRPAMRPACGLCGCSSADASIATSSAAAIAPVADATRAVPTIGATAARTPRIRSGSMPISRCRSEVEQVRGRRGIDRDERSDADEHQCLRIEARRLDRVRGHAREQVEDRGVGGRISHGALLSWEVRSEDVTVDRELLGHHLDLARPPALVEERLERAVEAQDREPALARHRLDPVALA